MFEKYKSEINEYVLRGYYIDTKTRYRTTFTNKKKDIEVQDTPNCISANGKGTAKDKALLMISIAKAKGWELDKIEVQGSEEFKKETKKLISINSTFKKVEVEQEVPEHGFQMRI